MNFILYKTTKTITTYVTLTLLKIPLCLVLKINRHCTKIQTSTPLRSKIIILFRNTLSSLIFEILLRTIYPHFNNNKNATLTVWQPSSNSCKFRILLQVAVSRLEEPVNTSEKESRHQLEYYPFALVLQLRVLQVSTW